MQHIYIDDGSTNIKLAWLQDGKVETFISANSFKREFSFALDGVGNNVPVNLSLTGPTSLMMKSPHKLSAQLKHVTNTRTSTLLLFTVRYTQQG